VSPTPCVSASVGPSASGGTVIKETALNTAFVNQQLNAPAGKPFSIDFDNQDSGIRHNMFITDACGNSVFYGGIVTGPIKTTYHVLALAAGSYPFICSVHAAFMTGSLTVK
jgi:plastocyanin